MKRFCIINRNKGTAHPKKGLRFFALICGLLILFSTAACGPANDPKNSETGKDGNTQPSGNVSTKDLLKDVCLALPGTPLKRGRYEDIPAAFRDALWGFADKTSRLALGSEQGKNALYSPISLYYPLAMLEGGAGGETRGKLRALLGIKGEEEREMLRALFALMTRDDDRGAEQIANSIWLKDNLKGMIKSEWLDLLKDKYYASAFAVDFSDPLTAERMNAWVKEGTRGKIDPGFDSDSFDPLIVLALMNTLYFKTQWDDRYFSKESNTKDVFHAPEGDIRNVTFMNGGTTNGLYYRGDNYLAGELSLQNGKIRFVLPDKGISPETLMDGDGLLKALHSAKWKNCVLVAKLPKFTYKADIDFLKALAPMGIRGMLQGDQDFSGITEAFGLEVSKALQKSFIAADENGIEAAAFTYIDMRVTSAEPGKEPERVELTLDRPFIYVIEDMAGAPLFVGIVRNPKAE